MSPPVRAAHELGGVSVVDLGRDPGCNLGFGIITKNNFRWSLKLCHTNPKTLILITKAPRLESLGLGLEFREQQLRSP